MNEELLQLAYNKIQTKASFEQFKNDFSKDENLQKLVYSKLNTQASFDQFKKDALGVNTPIKPKGVTTEQNTASQSASVNGGSSSASGDVRPKNKPFTGERRELTKKPKTFLQYAEEEQRKRPKIGQEQKIDVAEKTVEKFVEKKFPQKKVDALGKKIEKERLITQAEFKIQKAEADKRLASVYDFKYDSPSFKDIDEQDLVKTSSIFKDVNKLNIDKSDFARFLKNETNFYNDSYDIKRGRYENPDIEYNANKLEYLRAQSNNDSYLQAYLNDRVKFLKTKLLTAKDDVSKQKIANEISSIGKDYGKYRATLFPDLTKEEERIRTRNSQLYNRAKSGKGNALYQTKETVENFFSGVGAPVMDLKQTITEKLDETLKSFDINVLDTAVKKGRFKSYYDKWNNSDGFDGVYGSGKEVKFGKDTYIVTENGSVIDADTGSSINSFTDKNTLDSIKALANKTEKTGSYFSGVSLTRQIANTAGQIIPQVLATKGLGGTTSLQFARNAAIVNATMLGSSSFNETVSELTSNGIPEQEARKYASEVAAYMSVIGAVTGAISPNKASSKIVGQKFKDQIIKNTITAYKNSGLTGASGAIKKALNGLPNALKEIGLESISETGTELGETFGQKQVNSVINEKLGERILDDKMTKDEAISIMLVSSLATLPTSVAGTSSELFGLDVKEQFNAAAELNDEDLVKSVKNVVSTGQITAERGDELITQVRNYRNNKSKLPSDIKGKKAVDATQLIAERESLKQQRKNLDEVFHPEIDSKIENINNQLKTVLSQPENIEENAVQEQVITEGNEEEINSEEILKTTLDNGVWGMLTAENPEAKKLSEEENAVRNSEAKKWLEEKGYKPKEIKGKYGNEENSFFVPNLSKQDAIEFARTFNQESVATNEGLVYQDGSFNPRIEGVEVGGNYEDFYSTMKIGDKDVSFQVNYNFDEKINEPNQTTTTEEVTVPNQEGENTGNDEVLRTNIESPAKYKEVAVSEKSRENMTEDGEGNFVFYHYSPVQFDKLDPSKSGSNKSAITSSTETGAWSSAGGVNYLYTRDGQRERMVKGDYGYEFKVPMDKVYDTDADVNNYGEEAERRYAESHNGAKPNANVKTALITQIASENGYQVTVTSWEGTTRAQTNQPLTPNDTLVMNGTKVVKDFTKKYESNYDKKLASEERYDFNTVRDLTNHLQDKYVKSGKMENVVGMQQGAVVKRIMDADIPEVYKKLYVDLLEKEGMTGALNSIPQDAKDRLEKVKLPSVLSKSEKIDSLEKLDLSKEEQLDKFLEGIDSVAKGEDVKFSKGTTDKTDNVALEPIVDRLKQTGLVSEVHVMTTEEMDKFAEDNKIQNYSKGDEVKAFYHKGAIYINSERVTQDTPIHEFAHPWLDKLKESNPDLYEHGLNLMRLEGQEYIDYVKKTQPDLKGRAILDEAMAQAIGDSGTKIVNKSKASRLADWLSNVWDSIAKMAGISSFTGHEIKNMTLQEFTTAAAVDLLKGKPISIPEVDYSSVGKPIKEVKNSYPLSLVKKEDIIDIKSLIKDIISTGKKVSLWAADQLGIGKYTDANGVEHDLDAGISFALDPKNRQRGVVWASGLPVKSIERFAQSDYVFFTSGSPIKSKMFNKNVFGVFKSAVEKAGFTFESFVGKMNELGAPKSITKSFEGIKSFEELFNSPNRKDLLIRLLEASEKKTPLAKFINDNKLVPDFEAMRDSFLKENGFNTNDITLVVKVTGVGGKSSHSTYENEVKGEVVGVPDTIINAVYLLPNKPTDANTLKRPVAGAGGVIYNVELDNSKTKFSKRAPSREVAVKQALDEVKRVAKETKNASKAIEAGMNHLKNSNWYKSATIEERKSLDENGLLKFVNELQAKQAAETIVKSETIDNKKSTKATVRQNTGQTDTSAKVTISEAKLLKEKFKNLQRGFKEGVKETNQMKRDFIEQVKSSIKGLGSFITEQDAKTILNQVANVNDKNIDKISEVIDNLVSRLENRANKAKVNKLAKMQRKAKVKARTKYGNAGGDINKLIKLPANQIPEAYFDRYFDLMQKLAKGEPVNFNEVSKLYSDLKTEIESFIDRKNNAAKDKKEPDVDKVNDAKSILKGKINFAKLSTPKIKLTDFEKRVLKSFFEIPDSYLDQLSLSKLNELNKALDYFISTGYMPNKVLSDFVMKYKSEQTASNIINKVGDIVLKPVLSITGMIDKIRNKGFTSDDFFKNIQNNMLHHIDSTIKGIKGTLFYDNIVHPITSNFNKSDSETNKIGREVAEKLNAASKSEGSGFKVNVRLQMFFRQREFESNPELRGDKVFSLDDHMLSMKENENSLDYTKDDLDLIYQLYDEVKGKSSDEMLDMMTKEEKDLIDYMDKKLKEQEISSRDYNNHLLGETLIYPKDYFPRKASFTDNNADEASEIKARLFGMTGATSVKADSSNQRTANKANPLDFNSVANFMTNIRQSNIEKNLAFPVKQTLMTISNLKKSNDKSMITLANALEKTVKNLIEAQLGKNPYSYDSKGEQLFNKFTRNSVTRMLVDPVRLIYDVIANYPTVYGAFIDKLPAIKKASSNITNEVSSEIYKNISSTQSERVGGTASSDYKNAMTTPISKTSNRKAKVSPIEGLVDLYKNNKLSDFSENAGNLYYQIADLPARHLWKYYLSEEFRNITGNEFDGKKYLSDKNYREEVQESLQKAATSADKKTANYFNTGASSEQKLKIQGTKNNFLTRVNNFLRSFTFNENRVFWDSLKGMTGFGNTTFDSKSEAMRAFFVINARGITYSYLGSVIGQYLVDFVTGDDEEEKEMIDKKALKRSIGQHAALIALGNKGMIANFIGMFIGEQINARIVEEEKGKYNPYEDNMFYVPNKKSKYVDFLNNLGAEGAAIKTVVDFGSVVFNIYEKIESGEEVTKEDLVRYKTARHSVSLVSQATGLPIDRLGRLAQKALDKKYPYEKKNKPKKISDSTWGKY